jgi:3-oxoacyl-[acyl-carrier protein] reductase
VNAQAPVLAGKHAVVIGGGGGGIGRAISLTLAEAGADLAVVDISEERAKEVADAAADLGVAAVPVIADVTVADDMDRVVRDSWAALDGLDVLVTVVGGARIFGLTQAPVHELKDADIALEFDVNVGYVFRAVRAYLAALLAHDRPGCIVSIGSIAGGITGFPERPAYGASKAAVLSLARSVAVDYGRYGIRMNVVSPGFTATQVTSTDTLDYHGVVPLRGEKGRPQDIANAVLFFASPLSSYVTGQVLAVDGGASACFPRREYAP